MFETHGLSFDIGSKKAASDLQFHNVCIASFKVTKNGAPQL
jgi:hypothetical protein